MKNLSHIILPNDLAMISGVWRIQRSHELVTLEYTDGTREAAIIPPEKWARIYTEPLRIVSTVQAQRGKPHEPARVNPTIHECE